MRRSGLILAMAAVWASSPAAAHGFRFRDAEYMPDDRAMAAAQAFVAGRLPKGLPRAEALSRLRLADMRCGPAHATGGPVECGFEMPVHIGGGVIGEDAWTVRLAFAPDGTLADAAVRHDIIGTGPRNPQ